MKDLLKEVFNQAHDQAMKGKGLERHGSAGVPFQEQFICCHPFDPGANFFQAEKKINEAYRFLQRDEPVRAEHEVLGAINYLAAALIKIRKEV